MQLDAQTLLRRKAVHIYCVVGQHGGQARGRFSIDLVRIHRAKLLTYFCNAKIGGDQSLVAAGLFAYLSKCSIPDKGSRNQMR